MMCLHTIGLYKIKPGARDFILNAVFTCMHAAATHSKWIFLSTFLLKIVFLYVNYECIFHNEHHNHKHAFCQTFVEKFIKFTLYLKGVLS